MNTIEPCERCGTDLRKRGQDEVLPESKYQYEARAYKLADGNFLFVEHTETRCRMRRVLNSATR